MSIQFFDNNCQQQQQDPNGNVVKDNDDGMALVSTSYLSSSNRINGGSLYNVSTVTTANGGSDIIQNNDSSMSFPATATLSTMNSSSQHQFHHISYEQHPQQMNVIIPNMVLDNNDPYFIAINQRLAEISITQPGSDLNGNSGTPPSFSQMLSSSSNLNSNENFFRIIDHRNENHAMLPGNNNIEDMDQLVDSLVIKLNSIKQIQNEYHKNFHDVQNNYAVFVNNSRDQLDKILQEIHTELEQEFKSKMMELNSRKNQLEEILYKIENKTNNINNDGEHQNFNSAFDVDSVRKILNFSIPTIKNFPLPVVHPSLIDSVFRSSFVKMFKDKFFNDQLTTTEIVPSTTGALSPSQLPDTASNSHNQTWTNNSTKSNNNEIFIAPLSSTDFNRNVDNNNYYYDNGNPITNNHDDLISTSSNHFIGQFNNMNGGGCLPNINEMSILNQKQAITKSLQPKVRRERIIYYLKFGESGTMDGQFAEPSGVAVNPLNDEIFIADANNHRVQVFDKWGKFKFNFGDGKLKFPNRVALSRNTGDIVVSERPPVHQIQVYNKNGIFVCKFGAKHLRHPRGLAVDHQNRVVVVECKVMRVFIFNLQGVLLHSFDCSEQIQFPNAVAVSKKEEIFISDNRNHCVKVFNFMGEFLRQIGGQGITNYPIGVCLNEAADQLLVVDNYNNLNVTVFRLNGQLIGAYESSAKHQQCLDVALFGDHSIVVTSKDLHVYFYRLKDYINNSNQRRMQQNSNQLQHQNLSMQNNNKNDGTTKINHHHHHHQQQ